MNKYLKMLIIVLIIWTISMEISYSKEYSETCGDYTPVSVLLTKYKPCPGGWCLRNAK